ARLNKSDTTDAEGLAQLARTGWFAEVHVRSEAADRLRMLIGSRERLVQLRRDLEAHVRGILKTFGIRLSAINKGHMRQGFRDQLAAVTQTDPTLARVMAGFIDTHETLCTATAALDAELRSIARKTPVSRRLMTIPGVGPI
ncbi:transposase, partial [Tropicimonas sp. IMCC6043]|uniref:IS110 family transposase n=1 Tax=Tropicimonas sp. IMCC6043 TaxID=2510645 RepID=UPI00101D9DD1